MRRTTLVPGVLVFILAGGPAAAQMHGGAQGSAPHQPAMQGAMQGTMAADRTMQNVDRMMANVSMTMQELGAMHGGASAGPHHQVIPSMQGAFNQMKQLRGAVGEMMKDPALRHDQNAMKSLERACRDLEQMTTAF